MPSLYTVLALILVPLLTGGGTYILQDWRMSSAVQAEKERSSRECESRVAAVKSEVEAKSAQEVLNQFNEAAQAALGIGPTPIDRAELMDLCSTDPGCRERANAKR